jgi:hypothetical protein
MTGGAGFNMDASNRLKSNRSLKSSKRPKFKEGQETTYLKNRRPLKLKEVSKEKLEQLKKKILKNRRRDKIKSLITGTITLVILLLLATYFLFT